MRKKTVLKLKIKSDEAAKYGINDKSETSDDVKRNRKMSFRRDKEDGSQTEKTAVINKL